MRVFAGARWDPFILDAPAALKTVATGQLAFAELGAIYMDGKNVLEPGRRDRLRASGASELVGVVAETLTRGTFNVRIERVGRPEVKNLMLAPKQFDPVNQDLEIRDLYNMEDAFHIQHGYEGAYRARLNANLAFWDGLDGRTDWPTTATGHPLTELVLADYLVLDVTKPYQEKGSFLEIELAARQGRAHETCGGRAINDDVMDKFFTTLINAGNGPVISDGVDKSSPASHAAFPTSPLPTPTRPRSRNTTDHGPGTDPARHRSSSTTFRAVHCTSAPHRTSASTCCCASMTAPPGGNSSGGCRPSSTRARPRPILRTTRG